MAAFSTFKPAVPSTNYPTLFNQAMDELDARFPADGTFTPALTFGGAGVGITYVSRSASYSRIGNRVLFRARIDLSSKGSSTGLAVITGLPFTSLAEQSVCSFLGTNFSAGTVTQLIAYVQTSTTTVELAIFSAGNQSTLTDANCTNTSVFLISGHYRAV